MAQSKEEIEKQRILSFWTHFDKPSDTLPLQQDPPEPDFYVETDQGLIGLEHTRLVREKDRRGVSMMAHHRCAERIMESAEQLFSHLLDVKLNVSVNFRRSTFASPAVSSQRSGRHRFF